jgi:hypothetical protein
MLFLVVKIKIKIKMCYLGNYADFIRNLLFILSIRKYLNLLALFFWIYLTPLSSIKMSSSITSREYLILPKYKKKYYKN